MTKAIRERLTFANVTSSVALFFALGGGVVYAASVDSGDIKDDAVQIRHLDFPVAGKGVSESGPVVGNGNFQTVASLPVTVRDKGGSLLIDAAVEVVNKGQGASSGDAAMRILVDGKPEGPTFTTHALAGTTESWAGAFVCNGIPVGKHTVTLQTLPPGAATTQDRTLNVSVLP
ncbi:MAG: hypothetical protein M3355_10510 [Actinomycetota bacterium]|nr:hypothetical protein [Actinomycetota bacterium]